MSSPSSSLKKTKKSPLPGSGSVPFRHGAHLVREGGPVCAADEFRQLELLDSATQRHVVEGIRRRGGPRTQNAGQSGKVPSDSELLGSMATRLAMVERELLAAKKEIVEKNQYTCQLEEKLAVVERSQAGTPTGVRELEMKCLALQKQVDEMEEFLNDYGMVWVGGGKREECGGGEEEEGLWCPEASVVGGAPFHMDFDLVIKHIKELNAMAGEDTAHVTKTVSGARLKPLEPIPLTLYRNGIVMFQGPFRPYSDLTTQQCMLDLMDGYFPSELQQRYPDGVPFKVTDQRGVVFRRREYADIFPGSGQQLGGQRGPSRLLPSSHHIRHQETSELPGPKVSVERFLSRLPASVVRRGRVIDIRSGITETLQGGESSSSVTLVDTPVLQEIKSRLDLTEDLRPPTPGHLTTLRVKSEEGDQTYILKMKYSDTIGDVRKHLNKLRPPGSLPHYQLKSSFPTQTFTDPSATLAACGLVPSANIFIAKPP